MTPLPDQRSKLVQAMRRAINHHMLADPMAKTRQRPVIKSRRVFIYFLRHKMDMTFEEIGRVLGRDHSSILFQFNKTKDAEFEDEIQALEPVINKLVIGYRNVSIG